MRSERLTQQNLGNHYESYHVKDYDIRNRETLPHHENNADAKYERIFAPPLDFDEPEEKG